MLCCHFLNGNYKVLSSKIYMVTVSYAYFWYDGKATKQQKKFSKKK